MLNAVVKQGFPMTGVRVPYTMEAVGATNNDIAFRLRAARISAGLSQEAVGKLFSPRISRAAVAQWERRASSGSRRTLPDMRRLSTLAEAYHTSVEYLLYGREEQEPAAAKRPASLNDLTDDAIEFARAWQTLDRDTREVFRDALFRVAALNQVMPWATRHPGGSFATYLRHFRREFETRKAVPPVRRHTGGDD